MMESNRGHLLPIYVLADESGSMTAHIDDLNDGLKSLHQALLGEPMAAAKVRFSVLGFSDDVVERVRLVDLRSAGEFPRLTTRGMTSYLAVFEDLISRIPADVNSLKAEGYQVHRPAVFFLSDGLPNKEDWKDAHRRLTDRGTTLGAPNIIACGIVDADARTINEVATQPEFGFVANKGVDVGAAIAKFCTALTKSVIASGRSLGSASPQLVVDRPEGFTVAIDVI
ncbi:vWA domain-containing protein [Streptomyces coeruleorubidus]|uniref:vWA domain-containing protein n=1 Tax=Streptomyces coeruleorubidus TaxID=116188 RepID=UPI0033AC7431